MSQKSTRRARRQTNDEDSSTKAPTPKPNGTEESPPILEEPKPKQTTPPPEEAPPQAAKETTENETETPKNDCVTPEKITNGAQPEDLDVSTEEKMDPLIVSDEPDPELVFEENSDLESGRGSPVLSRCKTRRSLTRNIPTPKTPKCEEDTPKGEEDAPASQETPDDSQDGEEPQEELNVTFESCSENISTKAEVGGDSTRLNYTESNLETNSFLQEVKNKTFGETLRRLSTRRTIRPISDDYRKKLLQTNLGKGDFGGEYPSRNSVETVAVGVKRKNSVGEEECTKRFKSDSPGFFSRFASPLASIKNTFRADIPSSTPKLTGYKDEKCLLEDDGINSQLHEVKDGERRWCSIM